ATSRACSARPNHSNASSNSVDIGSSHQVCGWAVLCRPIWSGSEGAYPSQAAVTEQTAFQIVTQSPSDKSTVNRRPDPGPSFVAVLAVAGCDRARPVSKLMG